jgi:transcriptional regulator with XRE-family HTH domain
MEKDKTPLFKDRRFVKDFNDLGFEYHLIQTIIDLRVKKNMTQKELAKKINTKQSNISRMENNKSMPSLTILHRIANALDCDLDIKFKPIKKR